MALDMTEEWEKLASESGSDATLSTGVVVARKDFVEQNPQLVSVFLSLYEKSVTYANEEVEGDAKLIGEYDIVPEAVAQKALPECNITFIAVSYTHLLRTVYHRPKKDAITKCSAGQNSPPSMCPRRPAPGDAPGC